MSILIDGSLKEIAPSKFSRKSIAKGTFPGSITICCVPKYPLICPNCRFVISNSIESASELSTVTKFPEPIILAVTATGSLLCACDGSVVKSKIVLFKLMLPVVV